MHLQYKPQCTRSVDAYQWIGRQAANSLGPLLDPRLHATRSVATGSTRAARLRSLTALNAHGVVHKHKGPTFEHMPKQARSCWEAMQCGCMPLKNRSQHACGECSQAHACLCRRLCHCFTRPSASCLHPVTADPQVSSCNRGTCRRLSRHKHIHAGGSPMLPLKAAGTLARRSAGSVPWDWATARGCCWRHVR